MEDESRKAVIPSKFEEQMQKAQKKLDSFQKSIETTGKGLGGFGSKLSGLGETVQNLPSSFNSMAGALLEVSPSFQPAIDKVQELLSTALAIVPAFQSLGTIGSFAGEAYNTFSSLAGQLSGGAAALSAFSEKMRLVGENGTVLSGISATLTSMATPANLLVMGITALAGAFVYLMGTNDGFRESVLSTVMVLMDSVQPMLAAVLGLLSQVGGTLFGVINVALQSLAPFLAQIVEIGGQLVGMLASVITQLVESLAPIITQIMTVISELAAQLLPPLCEILSVIMGAIQDLIPPIQLILSAVLDAVSSMIEALYPIVDFVAGIISAIVEVISPIISFIGEIVGKIVSVVSPIATHFAEIFGNIFNTVSTVMGNVGEFIATIFEKVKGAWDGLTEFVGGIFEGIGSAFNGLVEAVKDVVNVVIGAINGAIWIINKIPGVEISEIPYLAQGTKNWQGGFAYINEGGRGELTYLPNGSQVIPHDISVQYAKEAARWNRVAEPLDLSGILEGVIIQIDNSTQVDGTPLLKKAAEYTIQQIGGRQRAVLRAKGAY